MKDHTVDTMQAEAFIRALRRLPEEQKDSVAAQIIAEGTPCKETDKAAEAPCASVVKPDRSQQPQ
ncbi:MAG: hypothetical protein Q4C35_02150 [Eubacteriales bacterium]|nr:hypothetical protein [Eubacteriales bacterium]